MAPTIDSQYKDLLNPLKDPEKAFAVNISELLFAFVSDVRFFTRLFKSCM